MSFADIPIYRRLDDKGNLFGLWANRYVGMFPNTNEPIDNSINIFVFVAKIRLDSALYGTAVIQFLERTEILILPICIDHPPHFKDTFCPIPVIFASGPSGDIRPKIIKKSGIFRVGI